MTVEPIIAFFLVRAIGRILERTDPGRSWNKRAKIILICIGCLFAAELIFHIEFVTKWIWHTFLILLITLLLVRNDFTSVRTIAYAVLPFAIISFFDDLYKTISPGGYKTVENYLDVASIFSVVWMIAMIFVSSKQQKAIKREHEKALQEEEQRKWMTAKKEELEKIVNERTAELRHQKEQVENTLNELRATQSQLIQSEKMASLGELTAGIAHEIQNPLNFVNNFSEVNAELIEELNEELRKGDFEQAKIIAGGIKENEEKIIFHGKRADAIVKGMLQHSRSSSGQKEPTDINVLADEYLRLAYHGFRAKDKSFNVTMKTDFDNTIKPINIIPQDIGRVILNLITNAFYAVTEKKNTASGHYEPTVYVATKKIKDNIIITVKDNGNGIHQNIVDKIFQPFFTTKPTGQGTGLGLSLSYDIVKAHDAEIKVTTKEGEGSEFLIQLPMT